MNLVLETVENVFLEAIKCTRRIQRLLASLGFAASVIICTSLVSAQEHTADLKVKVNPTLCGNSGSDFAIACVRTIAPRLSELVERLSRSPEAERGFEVVVQGGQQILTTTCEVRDILRMVDAQLCRFYAYRQLADALAWLASDSET